MSRCQSQSSFSKHPGYGSGPCTYPRSICRPLLNTFVSVSAVMNNLAQPKFTSVRDRFGLAVRARDPTNPLPVHAASPAVGHKRRPVALFEVELQDLRDPLVRLDVADANPALEINPLTAERLARRQFRAALAPLRQRQPVLRGSSAFHPDTDYQRNNSPASAGLTNCRCSPGYSQKSPVRHRCRAASRWRARDAA